MNLLFISLFHSKPPLASNTALQRAAVSLETMGELLDLLIRELDGDGEFEEALDDISRRRRQALDDAPDVVHEIRESAYYNLALWSMLGQVKD